MLLLRLWNFFRGYVIIFVEGYFLEKFINICTHRQIFLWDIKRQKSCIMTLKVSIEGFKAIRPVAKKVNCRVKIVKKKGMPFIFHRYKHRKTFIIGAVLFVFLFYILTSFIWSVEVVGNKKLESGYLLNKLASIGVKPGVLKYGINTDRVANEMMLGIKELGWVNVLLKGTKVKVQLVERRTPPELVPKDVPCNIVAERDGVIGTIVVKDGYKLVKSGDTVAKGQLLISGTIPVQGKDKGTRLVHAIGTVKARTWYESSCPLQFKYIEKVRTGKVKDNTSIVLFAKRIKLFFGKIDSEAFEKVEIRKKVSIGEYLVFPFEIVVERYYEYKAVEREISIDDARQSATDTAYRDALGNMPDDAEIIKTYMDFVNGDSDESVAKVTIECMEDIGLTQKIGGE